jgi:hypothetical protein
MKCRKISKQKGRSHIRNSLFKNNVTPIGFEPMAYCLEGSCSIQLSYGV